MNWEEIIKLVEGYFPGWKPLVEPPKDLRTVRVVHLFSPDVRFCVSYLPDSASLPSWALWYSPRPSGGWDMLGRKGSPAELVPTYLVYSVMTS